MVQLGDDAHGNAEKSQFCKKPLMILPTLPGVLSNEIENKTFEPICFRTEY